MEQGQEQEQEQKKENDIVAKIEEIYNSKDKDGNPKGKNFITHLLYSYFPVGKAQRVLDVPTKPMKCSITGQKLFAIGELWNEMHSDDFKANFLTHMRAAFSPEGTEPVDHPFKKVANGRVVALTGEKTDTYLCQESYQALYDWYCMKILQGDGHINSIARKIINSMKIDIIREKLPEQEDQKKIDQVAKIINKNKKASMSLGDISVLKDIHDKLKAQEEVDGKK